MTPISIIYEGQTMKLPFIASSIEGRQSIVVGRDYIIEVGCRTFIEPEKFAFVIASENQHVVLK